MSTKPPSRTAEQFVLRRPDGMRARIAELAKANNRSMNAEIVARLEASFENRLLPMPDPEKFEAMLTEALARAIKSGTVIGAINEMNGEPVVTIKGRK